LQGRSPAGDRVGFQRRGTGGALAANGLEAGIRRRGVVDNEDRNPERLRRSLRLVLQRYAHQIRVRPAIAIPALLLPGIGEALIFYAPPLIVARLLSTLRSHEHLRVAALLMARRRCAACSRSTSRPWTSSWRRT